MAALAVLLLSACGGGGGGTGDSVPPPAYVATYPAGSAQLQALQLLNAERAAAGAPPLVADARLTIAAEGHATYMDLNWDGEEVVWGHVQIPGKPGFTGVSVSDRARAAGYFGAVAETMAGGATAEEFILAFKGSPAHWTVLLREYYRRVGISPTLGDIVIGAQD